MSWDILVDDVLGRPHRHVTTELPAWNLSPDYQRGPVWTAQQQRRFIGHVLEGGVQPPIYVQRYQSAKHSQVPEYWFQPEEVIDGQQRLRAIVAFMTGAIPAEVFHDGAWHTHWHKDMDASEARSFHVLSSTVVFVDLSREERLHFYLRLNSAGTAHTEEELDRVRVLLTRETGGKNERNPA